MASSSSKDRANKSRDDCQIHVDKEGESCVIKIESVGQEKMLKELLGQFNSLKAEVGQHSPKETLDTLHEIATKLKPLEEQMHKANVKLHTDLNKKLDEIRQDLHQFKEQVKSNGPSKDLLHKLDSLEKQMKTSHDDDQRRNSSDLQNLQQQISSKNDWKPVLDAVHALQSSFDKEKTKPDILARKLDAIEQRLKESQPEQLAAIKDVQARIDPVHKATPQTSETLMKINDRVKAMHADATKPHPEIVKKLDEIDHRLREQPNSIVEPMKEFLADKLHPLIDQQKSGLQAKKDGEEKLGGGHRAERDHESDSPSRVPLCLNGIIPALCSLSDPHVFRAFAGDIAKKLADIQGKLAAPNELLASVNKQNAPLVDEIRRLMPVLDKIRQQQDVLKSIDSRVNQLAQNSDKEHESKKRGEPQADVGKEISTRTQSLQQAMDNLSKQQQPIVEMLRDLPKKLDDLRQSQSQSEIVKVLSTKLDPLSQSVKGIQDDLNQKLTHPAQQDVEKAIQALRESVEQLRAQQQNEAKKFDHLEQHLSKSVDIVNPLMGKLNEISSNLKQQPTDPAIKHLTEQIGTMKTLLEKHATPVEAALKDIHSKVEPLHQASRDSIEIKKKNDDIAKKIDQLVDPLQHVQQQVRQIAERIEHIQPKSTSATAQKSAADLTNTLKKLDEQLDKQQHSEQLINDLRQQLSQLNKALPMINDIPKQLGVLRETLDKCESNEHRKTSSHAMKDLHERLRHLDETVKQLPDQINAKSKRAVPDDERTQAANLRQVPLDQPATPDPSHLTTLSDGQSVNLVANLLALQTAIQGSDSAPCQNIQQHLKRIEQSSLVHNDRELQKLVQQVRDSCTHSHSSKANASPSATHRNSPLHSVSPVHQRNENKSSLPPGHLTKSRYITFISEQTIRDNWPKLSARAAPIIDAIIAQPIEFDNGTHLDRLVKQNGLEHYASTVRNAMEKSRKDYDRICYMMDSIAFENMTMIGSREAMIRPWDPSLLNRASSKGSYPYLAGNGREVERFKVGKDIVLWMVETDQAKPYFPAEFLPNIERLNEKYDRVQQPQFGEIRLKRREDETRWNERYAFTRDNRSPLFVNDLRSYFMDYDTKRKYQVHDDVPINPVCRTGIAGRGELPFWGPNHCVVVVLLRNAHEPEVVLMKHHGEALVLPKGFYGHEARLDNQIKIIQDPVSGQILPPHLLDYWWSQVVKLNETSGSLNHLKRLLNDKELKEEFAEVFSQKGCNKSVFDNGYVDHPLNTDHAWVESSVWKIQFKDWRIPEMKSSKFAVADELKSNGHHLFPFVWMKLTDALLIVPPFDRGVLVDILATGMPI